MNLVRYEMLTKGAESHNIPPTKDALHLHIKRANYQTFIWKQALNPNFEIPVPYGNGGKVSDDGITVEWMTKDPALKTVLELQIMQEIQH